MRARRRTKASAARLCTAETALPRARFLLEVTASQAILTIEAPDRDGLLEMLLPGDALIRR